jgi:cytoskeletal protein CcmA (bactofilin family)
MSFTKFLDAKGDSKQTGKTLSSIRGIGSSIGTLFKSQGAELGSDITENYEPFVPQGLDNLTHSNPVHDFDSVEPLRFNQSAREMGNAASLNSYNSTTVQSHGNTKSFLPPQPHQNSSVVQSRNVQVARPQYEDHVQFDTHIAKQAKIVGTLSLQSNSRIDGDVEGEIHCFGVLQLGTHANIKGNIYASQVDCLGNVVGDVFAEKRIVLRATAKIQGNLAAPSLRIEDGACFDGGCFMKGAPIGAKTNRQARENSSPSPQQKTRRAVERNPDQHSKHAQQGRTNTSKASTQSYNSSSNAADATPAAHSNLQVIRGNLDEQSLNNQRLEPLPKYSESSKILISRAQQKRVEQF